MIAADVPACLDCGACCFSTLPEYVRVFGVDHDRMGDEARAVTTFIGNRCYLRMAGGRCSALALEAGEGGRPRFRCTIYEERPDVCRSLDRGSGQCRAERHEKTVRAQQAAEQALAGRRA